jgi:hypothetical protein
MNACTLRDNLISARRVQYQMRSASPKQGPEADAKSLRLPHTSAQTVRDALHPARLMRHNFDGARNLRHEILPARLLQVNVCPAEEAAGTNVTGRNRAPQKYTRSDLAPHNSTRTERAPQNSTGSKRVQPAVGPGHEPHSSHCMLQTCNVASHQLSLSRAVNSHSLMHLMHSQLPCSCPRTRCMHRIAYRLSMSLAPRL